MPEIVVGRDDDDMKKYGTQGTMLMGKHLVGTGEDAHMTTPVLMDALRPHIIILTGKRGEGKCLDGDTLITLEDGSKIPIKNLQNAGKRVLALNKEGKIIPAEKTNFYKRTAREILHIKLASGHEIKLTPEHPLLTPDGWMPACNLSSGSMILAAAGNLCSDSGRILIQHKALFDEITQIETITGSFEVYDISVPEHHNFVANDIIVHNSYSMGIIAEELAKLPHNIKKNICSVIIDTQGIFWTMKSPSEKDSILLKEWGLVPQGFDVEVYVPEGQIKLFSDAGVDFDGSFSVAAHELSSEDWLAVFGLNENEPLGILLHISMSRMKDTYSIDDIISSIERQEFGENEKLALKNRFIAAKDWGIFGESKMPAMLEPGKTTSIDVSLTPQNVRALLVSIVSRKLLEERIKSRRKEELADIELSPIRRTPMPWLFIDEAHNFLPNEGSTPATETLNKIVKEGRQPGITLVFATQRPEKLHPDAVAQADIIISHRLTAKADIDALKAIMQTYLLYDIGKYINELPHLKGTAIVLDDNSERLYKIKMRPRQSWHAGSSPIAI